LRKNCDLKHVIEREIEGRMEVTGGRGRRRKQLSDDLEEARGYCKKKEEALDHTLWRTPLWKRLWTFRKIDNAFMNERNKFSSSPRRPGR